ncbi:MAG: peptide deformylase [Candidatus Magasanikbacteria bacterium CG_4_10_14_0_2_um_filter_33_14]|uniref:Peptide deformylase n=1 Tax=Candidatus Magasanikbacteria bacterium CG_4_10_14_0_2_um_filter_33_14 TaxID=1974636 RepID=A0A2M7VB67_9BACT|nr:MAG: peptide deformylase [Candidatus Magasanikbacteria bacterium CG_4_10_14_0_2_um_filter_33_14]
MTLDIITIPNENLRKRSIEVDLDFVNDTSSQKLFDDMIKTMYEDDGIGLAAPQIGKNIRVCVIGKDALKLDKHNTLPVEDLILINPTWQKINKKTHIDLEGCLSVPKTYGKVKRYKNIYVEALNRNGERIEFEANHFFARAIQHEVDHLDGILFIDKATGIYEVE